jgi:hypothetical protein
MDDEPLKLRELAAWYREFAEKTGNPSIWEARLRMAEDLEREAERLERRKAALLEAGRTVCLAAGDPGPRTGQFARAGDRPAETGEPKAFPLKFILTCRW